MFNEFLLLYLESVNLILTLNFHWFSFMKSIYILGILIISWFSFWWQILPTRAKSPKLSQSRSSRIKDSDGNSSHSSQSGRLSLDTKLAQNKVAKGSSLQHYKKPHRKSLPKLPSEKTTLANTTEDSASISQLSEQPDLEPEAERISEPSECQSGINSEPVAEELEKATLE